MNYIFRVRYASITHLTPVQVMLEVLSSLFMRWQMVPINTHADVCIYYSCMPQ